MMYLKTNLNTGLMLLNINERGVLSGSLEFHFV